MFGESLTTWIRSCKP